MKNIADKSRVKKEELKSLLENMNNVDDAESLKLLDDYVKNHETSLFQELGKLTRQIHDSLTEFRLDSRMISITENEIPHAKDRLHYVITYTEKSAQKVISAIEDSVPISIDIKNSSSLLLNKWNKFKRREMDAAEFRVLSDDISIFLGEVFNDVNKLHENLTEMLVAQEYQDITGQAIKQVIELVSNVETSLVNLIKITGNNAKKLDLANGERISSNKQTVNDHDRVSGQDDVDGLLSSLGF